MPRPIVILAACILVSPVLTGCATGAPPSPVVASAIPLAPASAAPPTSTPGAALASAAPTLAVVASRTQARIDYLVERVRTEPSDGDAQLELGLTLLQRIREIGDPSLYGPAENALTQARRLLPGDPQPLVGLGGLQLGRHQFATALKTAGAALAIDPSSVSAGSIRIDALIELGRYDEAFAAVDKLVARSADLTTLSRLSYSRELRGDVPGALAAMQQAAGSPSLAPENSAFAYSIVGHLERLDGDPEAARVAYERALALAPNHAPSIAGLGRLAVGDGDLDRATTEFQRAAAIVPLAEYVIALGETREAAGDLDGAHQQYDLARTEITLFKANGVAVDLDLALFEADHGDAQRALALAQAAYDAAPTVRAADALAWSLFRAGRIDEAAARSKAAFRLGSRDPSFLYHAGAIDAARRDATAAREHLTAALATDPGFSAMGAKDARALLDGLAAS
jgi:tetratricopeptide (TPR) repeat protein